MVTPLPAATVILVRDVPNAHGEWELFMARRHVRSEFAADVFVFPGGKVDDVDASASLEPFLDLDPSPDAPDGLPFRVAAIRELFEEAGVLLATASVDRVTVAPQIDCLRALLRAGDIGLDSIGQTANLMFTVSALRPFAHWITPDSMPRRYDTWFYLARMPAGQVTQHDNVETVDSVWIQPGEALRRAERGEFPLVFVTSHLLQRMARYGSIAALFRSVTAADLRPIMPKVRDRNGQSMFLLPGDSGY